MSPNAYYLASSEEKQEIGRLDTQHQLWKILFGGQLLTAPHAGINSLLDLGCGTAVWTSAVAKELPEAHVIGVDITPPTHDLGHQNLSLLTADVEKPWLFVSETGTGFDIITLRVLISAIQDWPVLIQRCFEHLKPGAWIEIPDVTIGTFSDVFDWRDESSPLMRWYQCYRKGAAKSSIDGFANQKRSKCLTTSGFTHISEQYFSCYLSEDAVQDDKDKKIAELTRRNMFGLLESVTKVMQERGEWDTLHITRDELQQLKEDAKHDILENSATRRYYWS